MGAVHQGWQSQRRGITQAEKIMREPQMADSERFGLWFCFGLNVTVPWFFLLGVRNSLTCFDFTGALCQETLAILERL